MAYIPREMPRLPPAFLLNKCPSCGQAGTLMYWEEFDTDRFFRKCKKCNYTQEGERIPDGRFVFHDKFRANYDTIKWMKYGSSSSNDHRPKPKDVKPVEYKRVVKREKGE